jgi:hypothetical protein
VARVHGYGHGFCDTRPGRRLLPLGPPRQDSLPGTLRAVGS